PVRYGDSANPAALRLLAAAGADTQLRAVARSAGAVAHANRGGAADCGDDRDLLFDHLRDRLECEQTASPRVGRLAADSQLRARVDRRIRHPARDSSLVAIGTLSDPSDAVDGGSRDVRGCRCDCGQPVSYAPDRCRAYIAS